MSAVPFDTLKYAEALKAAGWTDAEARFQAEALADALKQGQGHATKADLKDAITDLKAELKADISDLKAEIARLQTDTGWIKWIITGGVGLYVLRSLIEWLR
jgi:hypothetical protein